MTNAWRVLFKESRKKFRKTFEGDSPAPAIEFAKKLKARGIISVDVVSVRKAFAPPKSKARPPEPGMLWCPYCLKWRFFKEYALRHSEGWRGPMMNRCPVCTISVADFYVRLYNPVMVARIEMTTVKARKPKPTRRARGRRAA